MDFKQIHELARCQTQMLDNVILDLLSLREKATAPVPKTPLVKPETEEAEIQSFEIKRPKMICSETTARRKHVVEKVLGKWKGPFQYKIEIIEKPKFPLYKDKDVELMLFVRGIEGTVPLSIRALTSDFPPKIVNSSANGDRMVKNKPLELGNNPIIVNFRLTDVTSRYLNAWIYLIFYVQDRTDIRPLVFSDVTIRAKRWTPKKMRRPQPADLSSEDEFEA